MQRICLVVAAVAAALALGAATAAAAPAAVAFGGPDRAPALQVRQSQAPAGFTGGVVTAATGETVTVYVQDEVLAADPSTPQRFADLLTTFLHAPELSRLTLYLATLDRVHELCGEAALGCYSARAMAIVAIAEDLPGVAARSVLAHEYGHHVANNEVNDPWPAVDWGTKRWASYENVCKRSQAGQLFPGDEQRSYRLNPGEDFAETYRVLNERRAGVPELPWVAVDPSLHPDQTALDLLAQDVETPWTGPTVTTIRSTFGPHALGRGFRLSTPLDGVFKVSLAAPARSAFSFRVVDLGGGAQLAAGAAAARSVSFDICGQRSVQIQVRRVRGSGPFTLTVSQP